MYTPKRTAHYFNLARNASQFSDFQQHRLGAVLVYKGKIISVGWNSTKSSPIQKEYNQFRNFDTTKLKNGIHAEISAITRAKDLTVDWSRVSIFIYREHKNGIKGNAYCCAACKKAILDRGIKEIYFTGENSFCYERID